MKKIIMSAICITLLVVLFAGCTQSPTKPASENIVGLWDYGDDWYWIFDEDGKAYQGSYYDLSGDGTKEDIIEEVRDSVLVYYKLEDGILYVAYNDSFLEEYTMHYNYEFISDDKLELDGIDTPSETLIRVK